MVILRDAQFSDHTAIAKLHAENWRQHYRGILSDNYLDNEVNEDRFDTWYKRLESPVQNQQVIVAVINNGIVGFSCVFLDDDPVFGSLLDNLHVATQLQKTGVGKLLMQECAKKIRDYADIKKMYLWAYELNKNARKVYEHLQGKCFEIIETRTEDGTNKKVCRYTWDDLSALI